jgi:hypothetical protein
MEVSNQLHASAVLLPKKESPISIGQEIGVAPEPVWTLWRIEESFAIAGNRTQILLSSGL